MDENETVGMFPAMTNEQHHADPAIGSSGLKLVERSPLHYWAAYLDPNREEREPTPAMKLGTAWHTAVFEPAKFDQKYVVIPDGIDKRTKEGKALWAEIEAGGKTPITTETNQQLASMATAAHTHPAARVLFAQKGSAELSMFWRDAETGLRCKIRPDWVVHPCELFPHGLIMDGKSTEDASPDGFGRQAWNLDMALQAAWYVDGYQTIMGTKQPPAFVWLVQERDKPHATAAYAAGDDVLAYGRKRYRRLLRVLERCHATGHWPGYPTTVSQLELPVWAQKQMADEVAA